MHKTDYYKMHNKMLYFYENNSSTLIKPSFSFNFSSLHENFHNLNNYVFKLVK